jgi:hypothetical protein
MYNSTEEKRKELKATTTENKRTHTQNPTSLSLFTSLENYTMRPFNAARRGSSVGTRGDVQDTDVLVRRPNLHSTPHSSGDVTSAADFPFTPVRHYSGGQFDSSFPLQPLRTLSRRLYPSWLLPNTCALPYKHGGSEGVMSPYKAPPGISRITTHKRPFCGEGVVDGCIRLARCARALVFCVWASVTSRSGTVTASPSAAAAANAEYPRRRHHCSRSGHRRAACAVLRVILVFSAVIFSLLTWVYVSLVRDPYAELRLQLRVVYREEAVEEVVGALRSRESVSPPHAASPTAPPWCGVAALTDAVGWVRGMSKNAIPLLLATALWIQGEDAMRRARAWLAAALRDA